MIGLWCADDLVVHLKKRHGESIDIYGVSLQISMQVLSTPSESGCTRRLLFDLQFILMIQTEA